MGKGQRSAIATQARPWTSWYWTARWRAVRSAQLKAEPFCRFCLEAGERVRATVCDHVTRHSGDVTLFWRGPFQSLCEPHHNASKQRAERRGYSSAVDEAGWPRDPQHPANGGAVNTPRGVDGKTKPMDPGIARGHFYARPRN